MERKKLILEFTTLLKRYFDTFNDVPNPIILPLKFKVLFKHLQLKETDVVIFENLFDKNKNPINIEFKEI